MTHTALPLWTTLATLAMAGAALAGPAVHVSPTARPGGDGSVDRPFASLPEARDALREMDRGQGAAVELAAGVYEMDEPLALTAEDSGAPGAPVVYRPAPGARVVLSGGRRVTGFAPVTDVAILERLPGEARGHVVQADLRAQGITQYGSPEGGGLFVYFDGRPLTVARWPNEGFTKITGLVGGNPVDVRGTVGDLDGRFLYEGDRPSRWVGEKDLWVHGYWFWDWADQRHPVESIDLDKRVISVKPPYHSYGYRVGQWFYAFNALSEIDTPGEWYLDRETGVLYLWPPTPVDAAEVTVSVVPTLLTLRDASHVVVEGLTLEATTDTAITIAGGEGCRIVGCTLRNLGGQGVAIAGGRDNGVVSCDIYRTHRGGISLSGGDRPSLTAAGHFAENNHIHDYGQWWRMYQAGITLDGVGLRVSHNLIHSAPHMAIMFGGNDHLIEMNEIHHVCLESNDAGAMYMGRDWTMRGTVIRHNYLHDINGFEGRGCVGVYLDDMACGTEISGNVFRNVTSAAFIGGGRDVSIVNNLFLDCTPAVHVDDRAMNWAAYHVDTTMTERLEAMPYRDPPWSERYPQLLTILADEPAAPKGNLVARNVSLGGRFDGIYGGARPYVTVEDNLVDVDPLFVDRANDDLRLRPESPAWAIGFEAIPFEEIGLRVDGARASLPALSPTVSPASRLFAGELLVTLTPAGRGPRVTLRYTLDGQEPTLDSPQYADPIAVRENTVLKVAAYPADGGEEGRSETVVARYTKAALGGEGVPLSDLPSSEESAYAGVRRNVNMAGSPIQLGGLTYASGLLMHPIESPEGGRAQAVFALDAGLEQATRFTAIVGIEDAMANDGKGSVTFRVEVLRGEEWSTAFESPVLSGAQVLPVEVALDHVRAIRLVTTDGGDNIHSDHAVWAEARLY